MLNFQTAREITSRLCREKKLSESEFEWKESVSLASLTSFKTGGNATVFYPLTEKAATLSYPAFCKAGLPVFVLGGGTNVIARDEGYGGILFSLAKLKEISVSGDRITAQSGVPVTALASLARKNALAGAEFLYGIPGTVGGAVFMNAGAYGGETKDIVCEARAVLPDGTIQTFAGAACGFGYRNSVFIENRALILSAVFSLQTGNEEKIREKMEDFMARRREKQPLEFPSAGSTFKRCEGYFTAKLIDDLGLKGARVGGAMVSEKHAGFIINYDHATSADIFALIEKVKAAVWEKKKIAIECEVRTIE